VGSCTERQNLTDKRVVSNCSASNVAGSIILPFNGDHSGGASLGPADTAEKRCFADGPGRAV
jgi:hypothetical protein